MKSLGNSYTPDELKNIMKSVDLDGNGSISFDEFSLMLSH
jgi:Ca2+-binding EF-hand superfamily protein